MLIREGRGRYGLILAALTLLLALMMGATAVFAAGNKNISRPDIPSSLIVSQTSGNWSDVNTWAGGVVPTSADSVIIADGTTVTLDTSATVVGLQVGQGTSGVLQFDTSATSKTLTVNGSVTVTTSATLQVQAAGSATGHLLSISGDLTNNGSISLYTATSQAGLAFTGATNNTFTNNGSTDLKSSSGLTVNKGTTSASVLEFIQNGTFTVQGANTLGFLTLTNGTFKISGTGPFSNPVFTTASYTIGATTGIWLNNASATIAGQNGSPTNNGLLRLTAGTFAIGTLGTNVMGASSGANFVIEGGIMNLAGRLNSSSTFMTIPVGGTVNVCTAGGCTTAPSFGFTGTTAVVMTMSGGTINLVQANTATTPVDYNETGALVFSGGTLNVGTATTTTNFVFRVQGQIPNMVINNTFNNKTANLSGQANVWGNLTINIGTTLNLNAGTAATLLMIGSTLTNNGAIVVNTTNTAQVSFAGDIGTGAAQTYTGAGTFGAATLRVASVSLQNRAGVTLDPSVSNLNVYRINAFYGQFTNSNKIALGAADTVALVIQRGVGGNTFNAGGLDVAPTFNIGTGGLTLVYAQSQTTITTGPEIPVSRTCSASRSSTQQASHWPVVL